MPFTEMPPPDMPRTDARSYALAERYSRSPAFRRAFDRAMLDPKDHEFALSDPRNFLHDAGAPLPDGLDIAFMEKPPLPAKPGPDWVPFHIRMFNCRTFWVQDKTDPTKPRKWRQETVCFGWEIVPHRLRGPV